MPGQNGRLFADDNFIHIFLNENQWMSIHILLKFVRKCQIYNSSIGSDNGLVSTGRQAIILINDG